VPEISINCKISHKSCGLRKQRVLQTIYKQLAETTKRQSRADPFASAHKKILFKPEDEARQYLSSPGQKRFRLWRKGGRFINSSKDVVI
jgi:hypothetical protein